MKKTKNTGKNTRRTPKRRKKTGFSDAFRAFILVCILVGLSAVISFAVIMVHAAINNSNNTENTEDIEEPANIQITRQPDPPPQPQPEREPLPQPNPQPPPQETQPKPPVQPPVAPSGTVTSAVIPPVNVRPPPNLGSVVFVIDDAGNNLRELEPFLRLPGPITIAVLPGLPNSAEAARRIRAAGKEVILHQPMEAVGGQDPGPGAIYSGMSADEIRRILARNLAEVGPVTGMNNHQGSKITMDREIMQVILNFCMENNIYFLDSRTTSESVVSSVARQMNFKVAERNVFIDNEQNKNAMLRYISSGLTRARNDGSVIMIGHTWSPDLAPLLAEQYPILAAQGYTIRTAFDIIKSR
ncbi:MAG: divergent polysaccharide deacetylase family protein [Treponema sp.]|nr:divergent polysaccharide deacetylase family protein [Treponema sp.]